MSDGIKHVFSSEEVELSDGSSYWKVLSWGNDEVAAFRTEEQADECAMDLNLALTDVCEKFPNATTPAD